MENTINNTKITQNAEPVVLSAALDLIELSDMHDKLFLAADEQQRMEDEGGIPLNKEQNANVATYLKASRSIHKVLVIA